PRFFIFILLFLLDSYKLSFHGAKTWVLRGFSFTDWGITGPPGFFQNSGELAIEMLMLFPLSYGVLELVSPFMRRYQKIILLSVPVTAVMTIVAASSRGGQIALAVQFYQMFLSKRISIKN